MAYDIRFVTVAVLLAGAALFLQARDRREVYPLREKFANLPYELGTWVGSDTRIATDTLQVLGQGDFLSRNYTDRSTKDSVVYLFMAYFPSQRFGDTIHSPKNCLPGAGWVPVKSSRIEIAIPSHERFPVNRYVVAKGDERLLVLYWYFAHGRSVSSEYWAKFYLVEDSIRLQRTDGSLIRIATPIIDGEHAADAQQRVTTFLSELLAPLDDYVPR